jgi:serine/threonine-protein kinase
MAEVAAALVVPDGGAAKTGPRPIAAPTMFESSHPSHSPTPRPAAEKTVAVLPFRNAGAPDDAYLAEELTDDLLDALSMTRGLKVRARGAVLKYRGSEADPRDIGRELGVQVVVEGSVKRARGQVRISARLVSVTDGFQVWAKRFDRPEQDVLSINDDAARAIAEALTVDAHALENRAAPSDPVAIDLYLRARHEHRQWGGDHQRRALELFDQALAIAPDDPLLMAGTAMALARLTFFEGATAVPRARQVAERAVALAPQLGEAHLALGSVLFQVGEEAGATRAVRAALTRAPGLAEAHAALGRVLCEVGAFDEGLRRLEAAHALDADAPLAPTDLTRVYALLRRWDDAERMFAHLEKKDPFAYWTMRARTSIWRRDERAIEEALASIPNIPGLRYPLLMRLVVKTKTLPDEMFALEREEKTGGARRHTFVSQLTAELLSYVGRDDEAVAAVSRAVDLGLIDLLWLERCPLLDHVRASPRYPRLHEDVKRRADVIVAAYLEGPSGPGKALRG